MSISSAAKEAGKHLSHWLLKEPWHGRFITFSRDVLADIADFLDISVSEMMTEGENEGWVDRLLEAITEHFFELQFEDEPLNVVDDYLKRRGWKESKVGRDYLQAVKSTSFSVYEVSEVKPGESITVVDKVRGLPAMEVSEILGSQCISVGQYLLAKVLNVSDRFYFSATFFVLRPNDAQEWIMDISEALEAEEDQSEQAVNAFLQESTVELLAEAVDYLLQPLPRIKNMQGESLLFTEIRFPIQDKDALVAGLESWPDLEKKEDEGEACLSWDWLESHPTFKDAFTVLGDIQVESKWLKAKVNSKERGDLLITRLQAAFSEVLGKPVVSHQSLKSAFRELGPDKGNSEIILDPEILNQVMVPRLDEHYRHTLETSIPMLKDKTPREAVKTKEGRKRVIQWLLFIESNHNQSKTMPAYSFDWLWDELGLSRLEVSR